jgi:hypothetical protein
MPHICGTMPHIFGTMPYIFSTMSHISGTKRVECYPYAGFLKRGFVKCQFKLCILVLHLSYILLIKFT